MEITSKMVRELRDITGAGVMDCKTALVESKGDMERAKEMLRKKGIDIARKKSSREVKDGSIFSYVHFNGRVGVLLELNCETDFVARTEAFKTLGKEITLQIAAMSPEYISPEDVSSERIAKEKEVYREQMKKEGKASNIMERIIEGKLRKFYEEVCLLEQKYIKDDSKKIKDLMNETIAKVGENIVVGRFTRYELNKG
ncbi:MAG: translation elongation factor Ts [Thermotogae bacterium]|nr:translation elongation factor Ts [Thermotogota bacterium]